MKQTVLMVFAVLLLTACSAYNQIHTSEKNGLKKMALVQTPEVNLLNEKAGLTEISGLKVTTVYLYQEKAGARPLVTLDVKIENQVDELPDSSVTITLDGENVQLSSVEGRYDMAENLWVPIVHAQNIQYKLTSNHDVLVVGLNEKQNKQLIDFFNKAIKHRDILFPAIPPGMKKW
ncbi:MAG: hypothetical protein ACM3PR_10360 [Bacteroidales bacterium]